MAAVARRVRALMKCILKLVVEIILKAGQNFIDFESEREVKKTQEMVERKKKKE